MKYDIKDINLAEQGRKKAEWASKEMLKTIVEGQNLGSILTAF